MQLERLNDNFVNLKVKVDEQDYKIGTLSRNFESVRNNLSFQ